VKDTAQLVIFIRGIDQQFYVTEELLALVPLKGMTKGTDIFEAAKKTLQRFDLSLSKLQRVVTDSARAMVERFCFASTERAGTRRKRNRPEPLFNPSREFVRQNYWI
jgi:hypothetical protein